MLVFYADAVRKPDTEGLGATEPTTKIRLCTGSPRPSSQSLCLLRFFAANFLGNAKAKLPQKVARCAKKEKIRGQKSAKNNPPIAVT